MKSQYDKQSRQQNNIEDTELNAAGLAKSKIGLKDQNGLHTRLNTVKACKMDDRLHTPNLIASESVEITDRGPS